MALLNNYKNTASYLRLFIEHGIVLLVGLLVFWIDDREFLHYFYPKVFVVLWATLKTCFFLWDTLRRIANFLREGNNYLRFIEFVGVSVMLIVLSFALDYWCLFLVEPSSFNGVPDQQWSGGSFFNYLYFSVCTFVTVGYGDITPITLAAKYLTMLEMGLSFISIILVISNFSNFKEAMKK